MKDLAGVFIIVGAGAFFASVGFCVSHCGKLCYKKVHTKSGKSKVDPPAGGGHGGAQQRRRGRKLACLGGAGGAAAAGAGAHVVNTAGNGAASSPPPPPPQQQQQGENHQQQAIIPELVLAASGSPRASAPAPAALPAAEPTVV
jgi:hypothetical protein